MSGLPDFLIIGAMKCGTTTLQAQLAAQPGIFMTTPKEPNFFSDDEVYARGMGWYRDLYRDAAPGDLRGEASTHYTKLPHHPKSLERMAAAIAAPRLVYMVRDPVARAVSHYIHAWSFGEVGDDINAEIDRCPGLIDYGRYGMQIGPFIERYGHAAVCMTSLELVKRGPQAELERIACHIGYSGPARWIEGIEAQNVSAERVRRLPMQKLILDNPVAQALRRTLVPKTLRERIRKARTMKHRPELSAENRARLEAIYLQDREILSGLFPGHPVLAAAYPFVT